jgi:HPt (histidine-containing phosphotransfer) domain-containing protein
VSSKIENGAVDADTIAALREDGSLLRELRDLFAVEAPGQVSTMIEARNRGDAMAVSQAAHRLKGTAFTFGANEMVRACQEIEQLARAGSLSGIEQMIEHLSAECDRVKLALDQAL